MSLCAPPRDRERERERERQRERERGDWHKLRYEGMR